MKSKYSRAGAAALMLVVYLGAAPATSAAPFRNGETIGVPERVARFVQKFRQKLVGIISTHDDFPNPPKPDPKG